MYRCVCGYLLSTFECVCALVWVSEVPVEGIYVCVGT